MPIPTRTLYPILFGLRGLVLHLVWGNDAHPVREHRVQSLDVRFVVTWGGQSRLHAAMVGCYDVMGAHFSPTRCSEFCADRMMHSFKVARCEIPLAMNVQDRDDDLGQWHHVLVRLIKIACVQNADDGQEVL